VEILDDEALAFADLYSRKARENLKSNPHIAVVVADLKSLKGYQFGGKAELLGEGNICNDVACYIQALPRQLPDLQDVMKITTEEISALGMGK
jgi:hypothetical protein